MGMCDKVICANELCDRELLEQWDIVEDGLCEDCFELPDSQIQIMKLNFGYEHPIRCIDYDEAVQA